MAETAQVQSSASEEQVRQAVAGALSARGGQIESNAPGMLIVDVGSVGKAFLAGPFRDAMKMPMRITLSTQAGQGGTGIGVEVGTHGTGGGYMSGGVFGVMKSKKAAKSWMQLVIDSIPNRVGAAPPGQPPQAPPAPPQPGQGQAGPPQFSG